MATLRELIERMATDAAFAKEVRADADRIGSAHGLSPAELDLLRSLTDGSAGGPEALAERLSKSGLSFGGGLMGLLGPAEIIGPDDPAISDSSTTSISDSTVSGPIDADLGGASTESDSLAVSAPQKVSVAALPTLSGHSLLGPDTSTLGPAMAVPAGIIGADYGTDGDGAAVIGCNSLDGGGVALMFCNEMDGDGVAAILCNAHADQGSAAILCCARDDEGLAMIQCCARDDEGLVAIQCNDMDGDGVGAIECNGFVDSDNESAILCNGARNVDDPTLKSEAG